MQLFQVLPSVLRRVNNELAVDVDFAEALRAYLEYFESVCVACPISTAVTDSGLDRYRLVKDLAWKEDRLKFIVLPNAYKLTQFIRRLPSVRALLRSEIAAATYLVFSPHALFGDWPTVAIREAIKLRRSYVIEADIVYESVADLAMKHKATWKKIIHKNILLPLFLRSYRYSLAGSNLALFQGQDVYDAYASYCNNPHKLYHHIPVYQGDHISETQLQAKINQLRKGSTLKISYVGRAIDMKGPLEWLDAIREMVTLGVPLTATWVGDGSLLQSMRTKTEVLGITTQVNFPGFVSDRRELLRILQETDIFLFCHKTRESARCLGEALACGCPLIGYASSYAKELVAARGAGLFVEQGNWRELAGMVVQLNANRPALCNLVEEAAATGRLYDREARMRERMVLVRSMA